jgi:hypothetical protein
MPTPHLSFVEPESTDEMGTKTEFTIYPWGMTISIEITDGDRRDTNIALVKSEQVELLREFLNRNLTR